MDTNFLIQLGAVFTVISTIIVAVLKWNSEKFKDKINDDTVKRKEVSELLQKLYDDTQAELRQNRKDHAAEIQVLKQEHRTAMEKRDEEMRQRDIYQSEEIKKRDIIIGEIIIRIPKESRDIIQGKMEELNLKLSHEPFVEKQK